MLSPISKEKVISFILNCSFELENDDDELVKLDHDFARKFVGDTDFSNADELVETLIDRISDEQGYCVLSHDIDVEKLDKILNEQREKSEIFKAICDCPNEFLASYANEYPKRGELVLTGAQQGRELEFDSALVYIVQIRKGSGAFGSDMYLARDCSGILATHENQSFFRVTDKELVERAFKFFELTIDNEPEDTKYSVPNLDKCSGYIVSADENDVIPWRWLPDRIKTVTVSEHRSAFDEDNNLLILKLDLENIDLPATFHRP